MPIRFIVLVLLRNQNCSRVTWISTNYHIMVEERHNTCRSTEVSINPWPVLHPLLCLDESLLDLWISYSVIGIWEPILNSGLGLLLFLSIVCRLIKRLTSNLWQKWLFLRGWFFILLQNKVRKDPGQVDLNIVGNQMSNSPMAVTDTHHPVIFHCRKVTMNHIRILICLFMTRNETLSCFNGKFINRTFHIFICR